MAIGEKFPQGVNELEKAGLTQLPSVKVSSPKIKDCIAHMECKVTLTRECGENHLLLGEVLEWIIRDMP